MSKTIDVEQLSLEPKTEQPSKPTNQGEAPEPQPQQAVAVREETGAHPAVQPEDPGDLMALAIKHGASVDTLERLMAVRKEWKAEKAVEAFNNAMAAFQAECPIVLRTRAGHEQRYNYAPMERIVRVVGPILARHGFNHTEDTIVTENWVEAIVTITHSAGHSIQKRFKVPAESKAGMSLQQKYGAACTYAVRYAFCLALGIRTADRDTDCPPAEETVTELKKRLWDLLLPVRGEKNDWVQAKAWLVLRCAMDPKKKVSELEAAELKRLIEEASKLLPPIPA